MIDVGKILRNPNSKLSLLPVIALIFFHSCIDKTKRPEYKISPVHDMVSGNFLPNIEMSQLALGTDTICGMSLKDGVEDTLHVGLEIYGFCSVGCKRKFKSMITQP